ncbi:serpentine type 7TM GPCR chemoreceptor srt domain-containing protein [Ditylenchus destructor]|nr:serpentine type 7TM GPCR chemoreceptor srt domain-containing protein [Ditylenchus destructor]
MEMFLFRRDVYHRLYNCTNIHVDDVPLEKRQHIPEAIITIILCTIYYILYIPCMISLRKYTHVPCYMLLYYMSITDCLILWILGFAHGIFSIMGIVFCSAPTTVYVLGSFLSGFWIAESVVELTLCINRCLSILAPRFERILFGKWRVWIWIFASATYGTWWGFNIHPVLFNGIHFTWFFNPYVGYIDDPTGIYNNILHIIWDMGVAVGVPAIYVIFIAIFMIKTHGFGTSSSIKKKEKMMFMQVFCISLFNFVACSVYVYMMYHIPDAFLIHFAQFCWLHIHGFPPVIYLCLNKTIRDDSKKLVNDFIASHPSLISVKSFVTKSHSAEPSQAGNSNSLP